MNMPFTFRLGSTDADSKDTYDTIWTWQYIKFWKLGIWYGRNTLINKGIVGVLGFKDLGFMYLES